MGRGRKGPIDQSLKKPKIKKDKARGADWGIIPPPYKQKKYPLLLSEDVIAEMKKMSPQKVMDILLPNKNVNRERQQVHTSKMVSVSNNWQLSEGINNCQLSEGIKKLPQELREKIYNEYITIKLSQRAALGWDKVNAAIAEAPFCEHNKQIVKILFCNKCSGCLRNGLCNLCCRNGVKHFLGYPVYDENDYDEVFKKSFYSSWCGAVA